MIAPVDPYIDAFAEAGADIITAHVEAGPHIHRTMQAIRGAGAKAGLALNPGTGLDDVKHLLDLGDLVCSMTVNPGFGGQKFIHSQIEKVRELRGMIGDRPIHIQIDGGVNALHREIRGRCGRNLLGRRFGGVQRRRLRRHHQSDPRRLQRLITLSRIKQQSPPWFICKTGRASCMWA